MGKKMKLPYLFKSVETPSSKWPWIICNNPKTLSFRSNNVDMFKTMNSAYINTFESQSFSSVASEGITIDEAIDESESSIEKIIKGVTSERLFFELGETNSILEEAKFDESMFKETVAMEMDSSNPFVDFRQSMEDMVEAHETKDWDFLEEMLTCYLKVNGRNNHGYIIEAFVDLLVGLEIATCESKSTSDDRCSLSTPTTTTNSFTSPLSFYSSSSSTSPHLEDEKNTVH